MSPLTSYGVHRSLRSQSMSVAHYPPPPLHLEKYFLKTKQIKTQKKKTLSSDLTPLGWQMQRQSGSLISFTPLCLEVLC